MISPLVGTRKLLSIAMVKCQRVNLTISIISAMRVQQPATRKSPHGRGWIVLRGYMGIYKGIWDMGYIREYGIYKGIWDMGWYGNLSIQDRLSYFFKIHVFAEKAPQISEEILTDCDVARRCDHPPKVFDRYGSWPSCSQLAAGDELFFLTCRPFMALPSFSICLEWSCSNLEMVEYPDYLILRDEHPFTSYLEVQQGRRALTHSHLMKSTGLSLNLSQAAVPGFPSSRMPSLIMIRRSCPTKILIPWSHPLTQMFWYIPMGQDAAFDIAIQQFAKKESRP